MATASSSYTILLSMKSPIFAPLYLAKVRGGAFRNINFEYVFELPNSLLFPPKPSERPQDTHADTERRQSEDAFYDPLAVAVLSKSPENAKYIAGVADPFRALLADTDGSMYRPKIIGGLIRHQAFWLATRNAELRSLIRNKKGKGVEVAKASDFIVTPPRYTCGYAVLRKTLKVGGDVNPKCAVEYYKDLSPGLYFNTMAGFEKLYCLELERKTSRKFRYAYLTTDPSDHDSPLIQFANVEDGHNTLMSALFSGNGKFVRHPMMFDDLRYDLVKAMEIICRDPVRAAVELKDYASIAQDRFMSFSNSAIPHNRLVQILEDVFLRDEIYCADLKIKRNWIDLGANLRPRFSEQAAEAETNDRSPLVRYYKEREAFIADYFVPESVGPIDMNDHNAPAVAPVDMERTWGMKAFVRQTFQDHREFVQAQYETGQVVLMRASGIKRALRGLLPLAAMILGTVAVGRGIGIRPAWWSWAWFAVPTLLFIVLAYIAKGARRMGAWWFYDFAMLFAATEVIGLGIVKMMLWAFQYIVPGYLIGSGDKLALLLFCVSTAILVFGGFVIATLDRCRELWTKYVARWPERLVWLRRVWLCPRPCARSERCMQYKCPLAVKARVQAKARPAAA